MRTVRRSVVLTLFVAALMPGVARAGFTPEVVVSDNAFTPERAHLLAASQAGELPWTGPAAATSNEHNVREIHGIFSSGSPQIWDATTEFSRVFSAGRFDYQCVVHGSSMSGVVSVQVYQGATDDGFPLIKWASADSNTGRVFDVQFRVDDGRWRNWKVDTERLRGAFGRNDRPVELQPGSQYRVRARSQKNASADGAHSRWSPVSLID